ncbi:general stress protein [Anabaena subtropica]|uniref:Histidine kinase n=1 Tax=Anabaena subtropica FACHB-260 TaxID=2692884 RepID=A0ABR8CML0_9NOST|nr:general stress protein [Anabaena subtropica]MBD2344108.1 histidine kinase [Anabaena subtropica FACHB-260]
MVVGVHRRAVGVFSHRRDAEQALHELKQSGFAMDRVSVIAQDADRNEEIAGSPVREKVGDKSDEGAAIGATSGGVLGGLGGLLVGLGTLAIPGVGPIMLAGATATTLATTLAGAGIGAVAGGLLGGLIGLGIPEERAKGYEQRVRRGHYLVIVDGTDAEIAQAEVVLRRRGIEDYDIYDAPRDASVTTGATTATTGATTGVARRDVAPSATTQKTRRAIGVFPHRRDAEAALTELRDAGFSMNQVSLIAKDSSGNSTTGAGANLGKGNKADEGAKTGAATGGALGGLGGLLVGLGALAIPGVGPVIAGGAAATAIATTLAGGAIGAAAGGIVGGLVGLGIPEERARVYSDRFQRGEYLIIVDGREAEIQHAEAILKRRGIQEYSVFDATDLHDTSRPGVDRTVQTNLGDRVAPTVSDHTQPSVVIVDNREERI